MISAKEMISKYSAKALGAVSALSVGAMALASHAAADPDVVSTTGAFAESLKDNLVATIGVALPYMVGAGIIILGVTLVWKLTKRFTGR